MWARANGTAPEAAESGAPPPWFEEAAQEAAQPLELDGDGALAQLKNPRRAAEKARTRYGGDVSQLLDISRRVVVEGVWHSEVQIGLKWYRGKWVRCMCSLWSNPFFDSSLVVQHITPLPSPPNKGK